MDVTSSQNIAGGQRAVAAQAQTKAVLSSDFETFLKMLTAQARFQDPLEPIDSSEYAAQLAQFSMVEQQVLSNDLLAQLGAQLGNGAIGQMASWIGMEARTSAPAGFDGTPLTIYPDPDTSAETSFLVVTDATGAEVTRSPLAGGSEPLLWDGRKADGSALAHGTYSFKTESFTAGKLVDTAPAEVFARITEARRQDSQTVLVLAGGSTVTPEEVRALRESSGARPALQIP